MNPLPLPPATVGDRLSYEGWRPTYTFLPRNYPVGTDMSSLLRTRQIWSRSQRVNGELQMYVDRNEQGVDPFRFNEDHLSIVAEPIAPDLQDQYFGAEYTSGLISSHKIGPLFNQGRISASMMLPAGSGVWPAFWLYPEHETWPEGIAVLPEVDIIEHIGHSPLAYYANMHTDVGSLDGKKVTCETEVTTGTDLTLERHRFGIQRDGSHFCWFFDDMFIKSAAVPSDLAGPLHFMLNLAIGGNWPGRPGPETPFPAELKIYDIMIEEYVGDSGAHPNLDLMYSVERMRKAMHRCVDEEFDRRLRELA